MQYGESTDVADRVRMTFEKYRRPAAEATRIPRRDYGESTQGVVEYGHRGHSTDVLFTFGHSTDVCDVQADLQSLYLKCDNFDSGNSFAFCRHTYTARALQERRRGKHKTRGNY